jgi:hypothetical protein
MEKTNFLYILSMTSLILFSLSLIFIKYCEIKQLNSDYVIVETNNHTNTSNFPNDCKNGNDSLKNYLQSLWQNSTSLHKNFIILIKDFKNFRIDFYKLFSKNNYSDFHKKFENLFFNSNKFLIQLSLYINDIGINSQYFE